MDFKYSINHKADYLAITVEKLLRESFMYLVFFSGYVLKKSLINNINETVVLNLIKMLYMIQSHCLLYKAKLNCIKLHPLLSSLKSADSIQNFNYLHSFYFLSF